MLTSANFSNGYALLIGVGADLPITVKDATALYNVLNLGDNFPLCYYAGGDKHVSGDTSSSEPSFAPLSVTSERIDRLRERHRLLQGERAILVEKVMRIRRALIIETSVVVRFQLEQQLQENEALLARLDSELDKLEEVLTHSESNQQPFVAYEHSPMEVQTKTTSPKITPSQQFDVFVSYSDMDAKWVENLAMRLEDEGGLRVWLDKWYLLSLFHPGKNLSDRLCFIRYLQYYVPSIVNTTWASKVTLLIYQKRFLTLYNKGDKT